MNDLGLATFSASPRALVRDAWDNLLALRQRSALALLGILIGTASVVAMMSIGQMAGKEAVKPFLSMGVNLLLVQATNSNGEVQGLPLARIEALPKTMSGVVAATAFAAGRDATIVDPTQMLPEILAAFPSMSEVVGLKAAQGRLLADVDADSLVAVVGSELAHPTRPGAKAASLGDQVRAGAYLYRVVGILAPTPSNNLSPVDFNRAIVIPFGSAKRSVGVVNPTGALVKMSPDASDEQVAAGLPAALGFGVTGERLTIQNARQAIAAIKAQRAAQTRLLGALGGVSLLVGGLGVMNVMLMGMMERRREIGLRVALGATPHDIQLMFLAEAVVLAAAGGLFGCVLGAAAAYVAAMVSRWEFSLALYALPLGAGVAMVVGLLFGLYPAIKAARLDPIEALRAE